MSAGKNPEPRKFFKTPQSFYYPLEEYISLPKISVNIDTTFLQVINSRESKTDFSKLTLKQISSLLWYSSKVKSISISSENQILTHRNAPSAGAIHPVDIFISLPAEMEKRFLYYYNPFIHKLARLNFNPSRLSLFFEIVNKNLKIHDATLVWFGADIGRTSAKYKNSKSLVWRDAGALISIVQLVSTALKINSCPVGTLGEPFFSELFSNEHKIISGGGLLLG